MTIANKEVNIYPATKAGSPLVVFNAFEDEGAAVHAELEKLKTADFSLATINITDWNANLSPWEIPSVYKNDEPFTGGADVYLETLTGEIIPAIIGKLGYEPAYIALAGYLLAGLFAVYTMYRTDRFTRIASASGSMWVPGLMDFVKSHEPTALPEKLYLSLGDKEARTRNKVMATVEQNTGALFDYYKSLGVEAVFEMNPGNHFRDAAQRMVKGIVWLVGN